MLSKDRDPEKGLKDENSVKDHKDRTVKDEWLKRVSRIVDRTVKDLKDSGGSF